MTDAAIKEANLAFSQQITAQVARITQELNRLEQLLSAGMVDRRVLSEFREAVNKVRKTSWHVQCWLEGDMRELSSLLLEERMRATCQLAGQLSSELGSIREQLPGLNILREAVHKLDDVLSSSSSAENEVIG